MPNEKCAAEIELAREFPKLYAFESDHPALRPVSAEILERVLRVARNCRPMLEDLRARGLDRVCLDQYTPPGDGPAAARSNCDRMPRIR